MASKAYRKKWWKANAHRIKTELRTKLEYRYRSLQTRCKREGRKFKISYKKYVDLINKNCYYCGADVSMEVGGGLDRLNNDNPNYFTRGVVCCCAACNKIKSNQLTPEEMVEAMKAVIKYRRKKNGNTVRKA